ncbi:ankyrin domain protein [Metarhizium robertsii ARSEF 23]|uniref:Ankyrin domain protein n=1 Tax=Metarhizium robertsii (strain ARSEF 23 / ATCC MYA-3075) TaxID=655844 RepID=A0A0B2XGK9_METRA|nr:ankyrin domain protein [Metarhizium robertsii ARSEF 23]KHO10662.1 ankyrin domain protein [Metarhizium robertsii ARSEF 23]
MNVYRQPSYDAALDILLRWSPPERCLVAGDFNAKHYSWQTGRLAGRGDDIAAWAAESGLGLLNTADVPTNPHGNTIDLAFSNIDLASAVVEDHLATSSDHFTLSLYNPKCHPGAYRNARQAGRPVRKGTRSAPWWTDECAESAAEYRAVRRIFPMGFNEEVQAARKAFQNVLLGQCSGVQSSSLAQVTQPPPLQIDGVVYETQMDKANALRRSTLERRTAADDIDDPWIQFVRRVKYHLLLGSLSRRQKMLSPRLATPRQGQTTSPSRRCEQFRTSLENTSAGSTKVAWWSGITHKHSQAGALPKRWAVDLVAALVHDIEEAFAHKQVVTLVTADIQGAFDSALYNRLVLRLREQGWPDNVARSAAFHRALRELAKNGKKSNGMSGGASCVGCCQRHHLRPRQDRGQAFLSQVSQNTPAVRHGGTKYPEKAMRWLGLWLDEKLTFKTQVEKWTAKAQAVAYHLRSLGNTRRGPLPSATQRAVRACVVSRHDMPALATADKPRSSRVKYLLNRMNKVLKQAIRAILPTWRTTPVDILHRESGIPPVARLLEARQIRFLARIKSLDPAHPLVKRTIEAEPLPIVKGIKLKYQLPEKPFPTRLRRTNNLLPRCQRPVLLPRKYVNEPLPPLQTAAKEEAAEEFNAWLESVSPLTVIVYSDGSLSEKGAAGYGFTIYQNGRSLHQGAGRLGPAEVFDAEARRALEGLEAALRLPQSASQKIVVCLDNIAAARCLRGQPSDSSQKAFLAFQAPCKETQTDRHPLDTRAQQYYRERAS